MLFLAEVITTSGFNHHIGFAHVCQKWQCSKYINYFLQACDPEKHACCLWKSTDILLLSEVITSYGFERDQDTILVF